MYTTWCVYVQVKDYCVESVFCFYLSVGCQVWWEAPLLTELAPQCIFITPITPWPPLTFNRWATTLLKFFSALYSHIDFHSISFSLPHPILGPVDLLFGLGMLSPQYCYLKAFFPSFRHPLQYHLFDWSWSTCHSQPLSWVKQITQKDLLLVHVFCCLALHQQCKFLSGTLWISSSL